MNKILCLSLLIILIIFGYRLDAQPADCNCENDLLFLYEKAKKVPAYRDNKIAFEARYQEIKAELNSQTSNYDCFVLLNKLILSLNDNHSRVYGLEKGATTDIINDAEKRAIFQQSKLFQTYPKLSLNLDSLKSILQTKPFDEVEGIYSIPRYMTVGVYKEKIKNTYETIVLESENPLWKKRELVNTLIPYGNDYLLGIGGSLSTKRLIAYTESYNNGILLSSQFKKDTAIINWAASDFPDTTYIRKELSPEITYLKIGSFESFYPTLSDAEKFYKTLEGTLTKSHLIVDLRDNGGGGDRNSDILYKMIKNYQIKNKVYLISNHNTGSNAEQFIFKLKQNDNCVVLGSKTRGTLAYEIQSTNYTLPCQNFLVVFATKRHSKYLAAESVGISPDKILSSNSSWLQQIQAYIQNEILP